MRRARQARQSSRLAEHVLKTETEAGFFFGASLAPLREVLEKILAADRRLQTRLPPVLIIGETGTGKSSLARWLHCQGPRATQPLIEVNCSALPESLAESELFGHERGAFTDARTMRQGLFEAAHGGTLFLDELPSLSSALQAKGSHGAGGPKDTTAGRATGRSRWTCGSLLPQAVSFERRSNPANSARTCCTGWTCIG